MSMELGNAYFRIVPEPARRLVRVQRTPEPMPREAEVVSSIFAALDEPLRRFAGYRVLLDLRQGPPGRSDGAFEEASRSAGLVLDRTFTRVAVLVRSAVGKLQVRRLSGGRHEVFQDEAEALRFLEA
jgi:hypothetical protein